MCNASVSSVSARILGILEGASAPIPGADLRKRLDETSPVCEFHFFTALQRLLREKEIACPDRPDGEIRPDEAGALAFARHRPEPRVLNGRWKVIALIARGGMGVVYRGEQISLEDRPVAIKILSSDPQDPQFAQEIVERFLREARLIARLNHPSIVAIYDQGKDGNDLYYVMELLTGMSLADRIRTQGPLPWEEALEIAIPLAEAFGAAARQGVFHRDIKPENIVYDAHGRPRITDFGLAKVRGGSGAVTSYDQISQIQAIRGTPQYLAPERCEGGEGDERSEVYAFGMMLRYALTGSPPFAVSPGPNYVEWLHHQIHTVPEPLTRILPKCPREFAEAVDRAIRKRPGDRYQTFEKLAADLRRIASRVPRHTTCVPTRTPGRPGTLAGTPMGRPIPMPATALSNLLNALDVEVTDLVMAYDAHYPVLGLTPPLLRAIFELAREKGALSHAAELWAHSQEGLDPRAFEDAYEAELRALEEGAEPPDGMPPAPLDPREYLWMGLRRSSSRKMAGEDPDTAGVQAFLAFLKTAFNDPKLAPWRVAAPGAPVPPATEPPPAPAAGAPPPAPSAASVHAYATVAPAGSAPSPGSPDLVGEEIDEYLIQEEIGRGGMGVVYRALDRKLDRNVALKVISPDVARERDFTDRFLREARSAARLNHTNVVQIYRAGEVEGRPWYSMELVPSLRTLSRHLSSRGAALDVPEGLAIARQVAQGLQAVHAAGLIHRDIKPDNLMVVPGPDGRAETVKILDAGLMKPVEPGKGITETNAFLGTPEYCSPEQAREESLDARSDLYSLGAVLYEILAGPGAGRPYTALSKTTYLLHTADPERPPVPLRDRNPEVPPEVARFVHRLIAKSPQDRPASAAEVICMIDDLLRSPQDRPLPASRKWLGALAIAGALAMAILLGLIYGHDRPEGSSKPPPPSFDVPRETASKAPAPKPIEPQPPVEAAKKKEDPKPPEPPPPLHAKVPDVRSPESGDLPASPPLEAAPDRVLAGHKPTEEELKALDRLLAISRSTLPERAAYAFDGAIEKLRAFEKDSALTPWTAIFARVERERVEAARSAFAARPPAAGESRTFLLRDGRSITGKVLSAEGSSVTLELPSGFREPISIPAVAPSTFVAAGAEPEDALRIQAGAGDAARALGLLDKLDAAGAARHRPGLVDGAIEESIRSASGGAMKPLLELKLDPSVRASAEPLLGARLARLDTEVRAAGLSARRGEDPSAFATLLLEYPATAAGSYVAREAYADFLMQVDALRVPGRPRQEDEFEIVSDLAWTTWIRDLQGVPGGQATLDEKDESYAITSPEATHFARLRKKLRGAQKGYHVTWEVRPAADGRPSFWIAINFTRWVVITPGEVSIWKGDPEKPEVLTKKVNLPARPAGGTFTVVPHSSKGVNLIYLDGHLLSALPTPEYDLMDGLQIGVAGGTLTLRSIRVLDRHRD